MTAVTAMVVVTVDVMAGKMMMEMAVAMMVTVVAVMQVRGGESGRGRRHGRCSYWEQLRD